MSVPDNPLITGSRGLAGLVVRHLVSRLLVAQRLLLHRDELDLELLVRLKLGRL